MKQIFNILLISAMSLILFACQGDEDVLSDQIGYLTVSLEQSKDVNTKAAAYNAKQMHVVIKDEKGVIKFETQDHTVDLEGKEIPLKQGKYTIEAKSSGYDNQSGENCAYYVGNSEVTIVKGQTAKANVVCSLANVKVTVAFEQSFLDKLGTGTIKVQVQSTTATAQAVNFLKNTQKQEVYFPLGDLEVSYTVEKDGKKNTKKLPIENVKAKDHYIINFKNHVVGSGGVTVTVDPTMHQYTYDFTVDPSQESSALITANAWSRIAYLTAKEVTVENISALKFQYRQKSTEQWADAETTPQVDAKTVSATLKGLTAATTYEYQLTDGVDNYAHGEFTTETEVALYNGNFDKWFNDKGIIYPIDAKDATKRDDSSEKYLISFWDSGNPGTSTMSVNPTSEEKTLVHTSGGSSVKMASQFVGFMSFGKFAAGNLYTGHFVALEGTSGAKLQFGTPFESRPTQLHGFVHYTPGKVDYTSDKAPLNKGDDDQNDIYIALSDKNTPYEVSTSAGTFVDYDKDPNIIAYGKLSDLDRGSTNSEWREFTIDLEYRDLTRKPKYIIIVASASRYGDYFEGSSKSVMYVDDFSLIYGDTPKVKE